MLWETVLAAKNEHNSICKLLWLYGYFGKLFWQFVFWFGHLCKLKM